MQAMKCPVCGNNNTNHDQVSDGVGLKHNTQNKPEPGDLSMCCTCGTFLVFIRVFNGDLEQVPASQEELSDVPPHIMKAMREMQAIVRGKPQ